MAFSQHERELIERYEMLRKELNSLDAKLNEIDAELVQIERKLPEDYHYPGDSRTRR